MWQLRDHNLLSFDSEAWWSRDIGIGPSSKALGSSGHHVHLFRHILNNVTSLVRVRTFLLLTFEVLNFETNHPSFGTRVGVGLGGPDAIFG